MRNVRNFYLRARVDEGRTITGGPRGKDGDVYLELFVRQDGGVSAQHRLEVLGTVMADGSLLVQVYDAGRKVYEFRTQR